MNFKIIQKISLLLFIFVSSSSFAQYKYDIGLRVSSYEMEQFQLEGRFHLDNPYSIVVTFATGSRGSGNSSQTPIYSDSLIDITNSYFSAMNSALKIGLQRKLGFLASDVFYAGATFGIGFEQQRSSHHTATYAVVDSMDLHPFLYYGYGEAISSSVNLTKSSAINAQLALSFGMDVPITKRFSINAEVSWATIFDKSPNYSTISMGFFPSVSGGLRYSFGKRE